MAEFNPDSITPDQINDLRSAAEQAWGDDTRHPNYAGHPQPSAGHCYVTSAWLQSRLGGHVGVKDGHYFWVAPDRSHVLDLAGDQFAYPPMEPQSEGRLVDEEDEPWTADPHLKTWRPGPSMYKRADHPIWKGFRLVDPPTDNDAAHRAQLFSSRADQAMAGNLKVADLMGADPYPGEAPQAVENMNDLAFHDEPDHDPNSDLSTHEFRFVFGNGELHVSPLHDHSQLSEHAGISEDGSAPVAVGYAEVTAGRVTWKVTSNVAAQSLYQALRHYTQQVGWQWDGMIHGDGTPFAPEFGPVMSYWFRPAGDETVEISERPLLGGQHMTRQGSTVYTPYLTAGLMDWAADSGYKLAEYPGGGNMLDKMKKPETMELFDRQDPKWQPEDAAPDYLEPEGPFACPKCDFRPKTFGEYKTHMDSHNMLTEEPIEDGHFPQVNDFDDPLPLRRLQPTPTAQPVWAKVQVMVLPNHRYAARVPDFNLYSGLFGYDHDEQHVFYGAYSQGEMLGYGVVREHSLRAPEVVMVHSAAPGRGAGTAILARMQRQYSSLYTHGDSPQGEALMRKMGFANVKGHLWRWAAGQEPKDMIEAPIPFVYDIQADKVQVGYAGQNTHSIPGQFTPGGIVEGYYEPGGKITVQTATTWPWTVRHFADLWYWTHPQMEITSIEQQNEGDDTTKLAAWDLGDDYDYAALAANWEVIDRHDMGAGRFAVAQRAQEQGQQVGQYIKTLVGTDPAATNATKALRAAGGQVYVVGGAIRDALQQKTPNDIDLMVSGLPTEEVDHILDQLPGRVDLTGKRFGVYRYKTGGHEIEVALPRQDKYESSRRGEGQITVDHHLPVEKDLERRDFTANSMAVNTDTGQLIDPYGGADDITHGVLRTTHPDSFKEDPTRLVRALVAHGRFGLNPDERTRHEMEANAHLLRHESPDSLNTVLDKLFKSPNPAAAVRLGQDTGVLQHLFPEVANNWDFDQNNPHHRYPLGEHLLHVLDNTSRITTDPDVRMAALLHDIGKPASEWKNPDTGFSHYYQGDAGQGANHEEVGAQMAEDRLGQLNYPRARINRVKDLVAGHMFPAFSSSKGARKFLQNYGQHADDLLDLREADQTGKGQTPEEVQARTQADQMRGLVNQARTQQAPTSLQGLSVNGSDLIQMGMKPGPAIGQVLQHLVNDVVEDPMLAGREQLLQRAQQYVNAQPQGV